MKPLEAAFGNDQEEANNPLITTVKRMVRNNKIFEHSHKKENPIHKVHRFSVGDKVWFRNSSTQGRIGFPKRNIGPFRIKEFRGTETAMLEKLAEGPFLHFTSKIQHVSDLKKEP